jgi:uncharacterized membrane-anchored protein
MHFVAGDVDRATAGARQALALNARFAPIVRVLAASLARSGHSKEASNARDDMLRMEPDLTLHKLRARMRHMEPGGARSICVGFAARRPARPGEASRSRSDLSERLDSAVDLGRCA